jgi:hypothetical protein
MNQRLSGGIEDISSRSRDERKEVFDAIGGWCHFVVLYGGVGERE